MPGPKKTGAANSPRRAAAKPNDSTPTAAPAHRPAAEQRLRGRIFRRDGYSCVYCGTDGTAETLSIDHVQPRLRGGDASEGNLVTACLPCNARKGQRRLSEFLRELESETPGATRNFRTRATYLWPRLLRTLDDDLLRARNRRTSLPKGLTK